MSDDVSVAVVIEHASGVLAERFGLAISVADGILNDVARAQNRDVTELAAAVVASCTSETTPLPRRLEVIYFRSGRSSMSETTAEQVKERVGEGAQQVQQKAVEAKQQQTRERMRQKVDTRSTQTGEQMTRTASAIRQTAQQLRGDQQEMPANVLDGVADRAERLGQYLTTTDGDRLLRDVEQFARRQPWLVAGGGAVLGFVASRFMKASSSRRYEQNGQQLELERGSSSVDAR